MLAGQGMDAALLRFMAPSAEARYKSMATAIKRERLTQVVEFASGLSLRGVVYAFITA